MNFDRPENLINPIFSFELINLAGLMYTWIEDEKSHKYFSTESLTKFMDLIYCIATKYSVLNDSYEFNKTFTENLIS